LTEHDLKKQSQFAPARIGAKSVVKGGYGNKPRCGVEKNKAKQSQFPTPAPAKRAGKREKSFAASTGWDMAKKYKNS
jgi:hypothetical protein